MLRSHHFVVVVVQTAGHKCCHNLVVSIESFDCNLDSNNQNMIVEAEEEVLCYVLYVRNEVEWELNRELSEPALDSIVNTIVGVVVVVEDLIDRHLKARILEILCIERKAAEDNHL